MVILRSVARGGSNPGSFVNDDDSMRTERGAVCGIHPFDPFDDHDKESSQFARPRRPDVHTVHKAYKSGIAVSHDWRACGSGSTKSDVSTCSCDTSSTLRPLSVSVLFICVPELKNISPQRQIIQLQRLALQRETSEVSALATRTIHSASTATHPHTIVFNHGRTIASYLEESRELLTGDRGVHIGRRLKDKSTTNQSLKMALADAAVVDAFMAMIGLPKPTFAFAADGLGRGQTHDSFCRLTSQSNSDLGFEDVNLDAHPNAGLDAKRIRQSGHCLSKYDTCQCIRVYLKLHVLQICYRCVKSYGKL